MSYEIVYGLSIREFDGGYVIAMKHFCNNVSPKDPYWSFFGKNGSLHFGRLDPAKTGYRIHSRSKVFEPFSTKKDAEMQIIEEYADGTIQGGNNKYSKAVNHAKPLHLSYNTSFDYALMYACRDIGFDEYAEKVSNRISKHYQEWREAGVKSLMDALKEQKEAPKGKFLVKFIDPIYPKMKDLEISYLAKISSVHIWRHKTPDKAKVYSDFYQAVRDAKRWVKHNHEHCGHTQFYAEIITPEGEVIKKVEYDKGDE